MKKFKEIILNNDIMLKNMILYVMVYIATKWFMAVDLPYIIMPIIGIKYNPKIAEMCYYISAILGIVITILLFSTFIGYIIGCIKDVKKI